MQTVVIKYGGSVSGEPTNLLKDIARAAQYGVRIVVVHGGGPEITALLQQLGHTSTFVDGHRVTDEATLDAVEMVLAGRVGKRLVRTLAAYGASAVGVSGQDGEMVLAEAYPSDESLGYVGRVVQIHDRLLSVLLDAGYIPVVAPLGVDQQGRVRNINADLVAGSIAGQLQADAFILATDVAGVKRSPDDTEPVASLTMQEVEQWIQEGIITGGMIPKVSSALDALRLGAKEARIVDGRKTGLFSALLQETAFGTQIITNREEG